MALEIEGVTPSSAIHVTDGDEKSAMGADLEDGEIEDGEIPDEEICIPKVSSEVEKPPKKPQAARQLPRPLLRETENIVTEDDWAGDVEKAIKAAMASTKPAAEANEEGNEDFGESEEREHKGKHKKRRKRTKDGDDEHKEAKKRKKSHGAGSGTADVAEEEHKEEEEAARAEEEEEVEEGEDEDDDDDEEMLFVRGASPVMHSPMHGGFHDDSLVYSDPSGGPFEDQYESGYEDSDYEDFVRRRGEDDDGSGQVLSKRGRGIKRRPTGGRGRGLQSKGRGQKDQTMKTGKRPGNKRHLQRNTMMQDARQQGPDSLCMFYMQGKCQKGEECPYSHNALPPRKMELCKFYLMDCCAKKDKCLYMHSDFPCKFFHTGLKCFAGDRCKFSHGPLTDTLRAILLKVGHTPLDHLETAPKEILGDFPRLSREGAAAMVYNKKGRAKGPIPGKKIPSLFEIQVPIPPQLLAQRMLNSESGDDDGSPHGNRNHGATPMPSDNEGEQNDGTNTPLPSSPKQEHSKSGKKSGHKRRNRRESVDVDHSGDESHMAHADSEEREALMKRLANHETADDHPTGKSDKLKPRFYQETMSSADEVTGSPEHHRGRHHRQRHKRSKSKGSSGRSKQEINLHRLAGYSPSRVAADSDEGSHHQTRIIRVPSPPSIENSMAAAAVKLDPPLKLTEEDEGKLEIVDGQDSEEESQSYSKQHESGTRKEQTEAGDSSCSFEVGIPANLPKKQRELFLRIQQQQREAADSSSQEQEDDGHGNEEDNVVEENWYSSDEEEVGSLTDILKNLQQQTKEQQQQQQQNSQKSVPVSQRSTTPPLPPSSTSTASSFSAVPPMFKLGDLSSINISESVSKLLSSIRNSSAINMPQTSGGVAPPAKSVTSTVAPSTNLSTSDKDPRLSHGASPAARDPRLVSRDPRNRSSVLLSPSSSSSSSNTDPRNKPAEETRPAIRSVRRSSSSSFTSIYSSAITLPLAANTPVSERETGGGDTDLRSYLPPAISDTDLRQSLGRFGDTDLRTGPSDVDLRGMLSLPFKPVPMHTPATEIDASLTSHPPIHYKVVPISIPRPDYSGLKLTISDPQVHSDPRLRKLFKISSSTPSSTSTTTATSTVAAMSPASPPPQTPPQTKPVARADPRRRGQLQAQQEQPPTTSPNPPSQAASLENMGVLQMPFALEQPMGMMTGSMILDPRRRNNAPGLLGPAPGVPYGGTLQQLPPVMPSANSDGSKLSVDMDLRPTAGSFFHGSGAWNPEQQMAHQHQQQHRGRNWPGVGIRRGSGHPRFQKPQQQPDRSYTPPL